MNEERKKSLYTKKLENILDSLESFIYTKDLQGRYTYANKKVLDMFGKTFEELVGKDDSHFFDLKLSDQLLQNDLKVMRDNVAVENEERNIIRSTGEERIYKVIKKPLVDDNGNVIGLSGTSTDITEKKILERINKEQKQLLNIVLDNVDAHIYMKDNKRHFKYVNSRVATLFGFPAEEIIGRLDTDVLPKEVADHFWSSDKQVFKTNTRLETHEEQLDKDGVVHHYLSTKIPYQFEDNSKVLIGFSSDVTELYKLKEQYQEQANTDSLTGLYSHRYFFEHADREFNKAKCHNTQLSVITIDIDIDNFKLINDQFGHPVGDQVLLDVSKNLMPSLRGEDILARTGGEEFSIFLPQASPEKAQIIAQRIRAFQDESMFTFKDITLSVKVSVGIASLKPSDTSFQALYSRSDKALYQAKHNGKNTIHYLK